MGIWRTLYNIIGIDYTGTAEQKIIDKQKRLKYLALEELKNKNNKHLLNIDGQFIIKMVNKHKKSKKN
jgi:hypothetical protein